MNLLNPTLWNNIGVVTVVVLAGISVAKGWLVPRSLHREMLSHKDGAISDLRARAAEDAATIRVQAETISSRDGAELVATRLLRETRAE
ncbi:hypothetical protein [Mycolicibacterium helvum]|uniref:Uncharacterized protein n=1 Tax=Mycolicibacterium helvum TaxID=1534349 RepID=A0A7I7T2E9_9MYCO|nr:hypothetical protein [Mycolicibacterium helvum]BBY63120.1 hypothetical protein MHEL_13630 [Mycolicibacterium helvum]